MGAQEHQEYGNVDGKDPIAMRRYSSTKGSILVITLWSLFLLTTFVIYLSYGVRQKLTLVKRLEERDQLHYISEAGVKTALFEIAKENNVERTSDALRDNWSNNPGMFKDRRIGEGRFSVLYNYLDEESRSPGVRYGLIDEERKININTMDRAALQRLFKIVLGADEIEQQELAASIIDWRDGDSELTIPLGSGEDFYYRGLRYSYEAKDAEFEVLDELLLVKGVTGDVYAKIKDYITIYGDGKVNINTAEREVLFALGLHAGLVSKILIFRRGEDGISATSDDNVFNNTSDIVPRLSQHQHLSASEVAELTMIRDRYLSTGSNNFSINSVSGLIGRKNTSTTKAVINRDGEILYWHES
ncbi:MAG: hypothetical protein ABID09_02565 [Candidatus Omnitrophota bacterium]